MSLYFLIQCAVVARVFHNMKLLHYEEYAAATGKPVRKKLNRSMIMTMRPILLDHLRKSDTLATEVAKDPGLMALVDAGNLAVTEFIDRTSQVIVESYIEFPLATWLSVFRVHVAVAFLITFTCFPAFVAIFLFTCTAVITAVFFVVWFCVQAGRMHKGKGLLISPILQKLLWPFMFVGIPFSFGYAPWAAKPTDLRATTQVQVHVYCLCHMIMWAWVDTSSSFYYVNHLFSLSGHIVGGFKPYQAMIIHICICIFCIYVSSWLQSSTVFMLCFPPYVSKEEELILIAVLREFPHGMPAPEVGATEPAIIMNASTSSTGDVVVVSSKTSMEEADSQPQPSPEPVIRLGPGSIICVPDESRKVTEVDHL